MRPTNWTGRGTHLTRIVDTNGYPALYRRGGLMSRYQMDINGGNMGYYKRIRDLHDLTGSWRAGCISAMSCRISPGHSDSLADLYGTSTNYILGRTDDPRFSGAKGSEPAWEGMAPCQVWKDMVFYKRSIPASKSTFKGDFALNTIVTDTNSGISAKEAQEMGIDLIPMPFLWMGRPIWRERTVPLRRSFKDESGGGDQHLPACPGEITSCGTPC